MPKIPSSSIFPRKSTAGNSSRARMDPEQAEIRDFERRAKERKRKEENRRKAEARQRREVEKQKRQQEKEQEKQRQDEEKKKKAEEKQGKEARKQEWAKYVVDNRWKVVKDFKHPNGVQTIVKMDAMKLTKPRLKPEELETLPHQKCPTGYHPPESEMHLYSLTAVKELAKLRADALGELRLYPIPGPS